MSHLTCTSYAYYKLDNYLAIFLLAAAGLALIATRSGYSVHASFQRMTCFLWEMYVTWNKCY